MKRFTLIWALMAAVLFPLASFAQSRTISSADRQRWLSEIREYKHDFLIKELNLNKEQQRDFLPLYDEMEDEIERINSETRDLEARVRDNKDASAVEIENAARTIFEQKRAEGQVEMTYFERFKSILTPAQLLNIKPVERKFTQALVKQHRRMRSADKPAKR